MNCQTIRPLLLSYLEGEVTPSEQKLIHAHLADCGHCQDELNTLGTLQNQVRQTLRSKAAEAVPPSQSWEELQVRLAHQRGSPVFILRFRQVFQGVQAVAGIAVILLLALAAMLVLSPDRRASTATSQSSGAEAVNRASSAPPAHVSDAVAPAPVRESDVLDATPTDADAEAGPEMRIVAGLRYEVWPGNRCGQYLALSEPVPTPSEEEQRERLEQFHAQEQPITLEEAQALPFGIPTWVPEGFELQTIRNDGRMVFLTWEDGYRQSISFIAVPFEPNGMPMLQRSSIPVVEGAVREVEVNGRSAALVKGVCNMTGVTAGGLGFWGSQDTDAHLNWVSTTRPFSYTLIKFANDISVNEEELLQMAESIP